MPMRPKLLCNVCRYLAVSSGLNCLIDMGVAYKALGANVSGLTAYGPPGNDEHIPLRFGKLKRHTNRDLRLCWGRWGEVIPIHFMHSKHARLVILSQPSRRYDNDVVMIPELLQLGRYNILILILLICEYFRKRST